MIDTILNLLFRCPHKRTTRPVTPFGKGADRAGETYVVCLECGKEFFYDLTEMRIGKPVPPTSPSGIVPPEVHHKSKKIKYAALVSIIPLAWLIPELPGHSFGGFLKDFRINHARGMIETKAAYLIFLLLW